MRDSPTITLNVLEIEMFDAVWSRLPMEDTAALCVTVMRGDWANAEPFTVFTMCYGDGLGDDDD